MNYNMNVINEHRAYIDELRAQLAERDARIAELEAWQETAERMEEANQLQRKVIAMQKQRIAELYGGLCAALELIEDCKDVLEDARVWTGFCATLKQKAEHALNKPVTDVTP